MGSRRSRRVECGVRSLVVGHPSFRHWRRKALRGVTVPPDLSVGTDDSWAALRDATTLS